MGARFTSVFVGAALVAVAVIPSVALAQSSETRLKLTGITFLPPVPAITPVPAAPRVPAPPSTYSWTGLYVGGLIGQAMGKGTATTTTTFSPVGYFAQSSVDAVNAVGPQELKPSKITFGGEAGFVGQAGNLVLGVEGDYSMMKLDDTVDKTVVYPGFAPTSFTVEQRIRTTYLITIRGRLGVAAGPALIFGTAGLAMTDFELLQGFTDTFDDVLETGVIQEKPRKFIYGGGAEFRLGSHASIKGEFLHADFGTFTTTSTDLEDGSGSAFPQNVFTHAATFKLNIIRFGVNFGF